jgi:hypothetical protein
MADRRNLQVGFDFPIRRCWTVSGLCVGERCWVCGCRVVEIGGEEGVTLASCDCAFPEDHHEMEVL